MNAGHAVRILYKVSVMPTFKFKDVAYCLNKNM